MLATVPGGFSSEVPSSETRRLVTPTVHELQGIREERGTDVHALMDGYASISP